MPVGRTPPALPDTAAPSQTPTPSTQNTHEEPPDWYAAYLRMNGQNAKVYIEPAYHNQINTGTITNDRIQQMPEPAYYDTKTGTAYRYTGLFLSGLTLGLDRVNTRKMNQLAKTTYYAGRVVGAAGLGYGLGMVGGSLLGASSRATTIAGRIAEFGSRHPAVVSAAKGAMKGVLIGGEAARGIKMKMEGYGWSDVVGTIGSDFAGLYMFERGMSSGFVNARKTAVRRQFAEKNTKSKQITKFRAKMPKDSGYVRPPHVKTADLSDELRFLEGEKNLPPKLYTEKKLIVKRFHATKGNAVTTGKGTEQLLKTNAITITKLNIGRTRLDEAARVVGIKSDYMRMMKNTMPKITGIGNNISKAAPAALGAIIGVSTATPTGYTRAATATPQFSTPTSSKNREIVMENVEKNTDHQGNTTNTITSAGFSIGTDNYYWTGVRDIYSEFPLSTTNNKTDNKSDIRPKREPDSETPLNEDQSDTTDILTFPSLTPSEAQQSDQNIAHKQTYKLGYLQGIQMISLSSTKIKMKKTAPKMFLLRRAKQGGFGVVDNKKSWMRRNKWGELKLGLDSLKESLRNMRYEAIGGFVAMSKTKTRQKRR